MPITTFVVRTLLVRDDVAWSCWILIFLFQLLPIRRVVKLHTLFLCDREINLPLRILCSQFVMMTTIANTFAAPLTPNVIADTAANYVHLVIARAPISILLPPLMPTGMSGTGSLQTDDCDTLKKKTRMLC